MTVTQAFQIALAHHQAGRFAEAEMLYRQILAVQPNHVDTLHLVGVLAHQAGRHDVAIQWIERALALNPNHAVAHSNLGEAYRMSGRLEEAIRCYRRAIQVAPDSAEAHSNLGGVLLELGERAESMEACRRAVALRPNYPEANNNLGNALRAQGDFESAIACYRRAIEAAPQFAAALNNLGDALKQQGLVEEAITTFRRARDINPANAFVWSNLIYTLLFASDAGPDAIRLEQECWNRQFAGDAKRESIRYANDRDSERRLRIGYVSSDFRNHVVGRNLLPLFEAHDRERFEIFCYSGVVQADALTRRIQDIADHWRDVHGLDDGALATTIREDGVDILVDLSQHLAGNRLTMFTHRPAPVQVSFAGYPESAGAEAIPNRISDRYLETEERDITGARPSGEQVFLIDSFWCYRPEDTEVELNELPLKRNGFVTFGSLNNFCKVNDAVVKVWARVLASVAESRLILLCAEGSHRRQTKEAFQGRGIEESRIEFVEPCSHLDYLKLYHLIDIVLDPFPYNGHTTSLDAMWMGVPLVTLVGKRSISRAGLSQLSNLGLTDLIAWNDEEYVQIAAKLAGDVPRLTELRNSLRRRMEGSVLMDAPHFAGQIEAAYRQMWRQWCETQSA